MKKKVVAIGGGPRRSGATGMLLDSAINGLENNGIMVERFYANSLGIEPCLGCNHCLKLNDCILQDDMQLFRKLFLEADGFIFSSPIYFGSITAQLKKIIDRCQVFWAIKKNNKGLASVNKWRPVVFLSASGMDNKQGTRFDGALEVINNFGYALDTKLLGTVLVPNTDLVPVLEDSECIHEAYQQGKLLGEEILKG